MSFLLNDKELAKNQHVYKVDRLKLTLKTDFRISLYELWREGRTDEVGIELERNGFGPEHVGADFFGKLIQSFKNGGYPVFKSDELALCPEKANENPLVRSGKYEYTGRKGDIRLREEFEKALFLRYPEVSVEEGIRLLGLNPLDVGYQRIKRLEREFEHRIKKMQPDAAGHYEAYREVPERAEVHPAEGGKLLSHPYVRGIDGDGILLMDCFYNEACLLADRGVGKLLEVYELPVEAFKERQILGIGAKLSRWQPTGNVMEGASALLVRIWHRRMVMMEESVAENFRRLRGTVPEMDIEGRRRIARWVDSLPRDPWGHYTRSRILEEIGLARSTYYELLNNEDYGKAGERRLARDEEDILLVRKVADYKGYAKGYRQISMMMESVTGRTMSEHRVLCLMRKYGMRTNIRRPSRNRKAMKELMLRNGKENLLMRRFRLHRPNEVRLTDVTYLDYGGGQRAYGSASIDPVTDRLICFVVSERNDLQLALDTLDAMDAYPAVNGGIIHSDQGILYFTDDFQSAVKERNLVQSMSRRGNCWDNASCESFFGHFKDESGYTGCKTLEELRENVRDYGLYYNEERRIHSRGKMTPVEYEAYLDAMDPGAFAAYMAEEEKKYLKKKEEAAARAAERARERRDAAAARLEEIADETC